MIMTGMEVKASGKLNGYVSRDPRPNRHVGIVADRPAGENIVKGKGNVQTRE